MLVDRVVLGTPDGRILTLDLDGGKPLWQTQLGEHAASNLLATDDFVVARYLEGNTSAQIVAYDTFSGQIISRREFNSEAGVPAVPINLALAPDGMLVYLLPNQIVGVDLFAPDALHKDVYNRPALRASARSTVLTAFCSWSRSDFSSVSSSALRKCDSASSIFFLL